VIEGFVNVKNILEARDVRKLKSAFRLEDADFRCGAGRRRKHLKIPQSTMHRAIFGIFSFSPPMNDPYPLGACGSPKRTKHSPPVPGVGGGVP
jgi:hypothetical protein